MKGDTALLPHIQESIRRIEENTASGRQSFMDSHTLQDAVLRNLQTMAESTQRFSDGLKDAFPEVQWRRLVVFPERASSRLPRYRPRSDVAGCPGGCVGIQRDTAGFARGCRTGKMSQHICCA